MAELGLLVPQDVLLEGTSWRESSIDVAIAGKVTSVRQTIVMCAVVKWLMNAELIIVADVWPWSCRSRLDSSWSEGPS